MKERTIDLNADIGESPRALTNGSDAELMRLLTSVNVACGGHAGDEYTMFETLRIAKPLGLAVGAHPSFPDREHFGRVEMTWPPEKIENSVREQIAALIGVAKKLGTTVVHVKPHGALYNAASRNKELAEAIGRAVLSLDPHLVLVGLAGTPCLKWWAGMGLQCAAEAFADRAYEPDGSLRSRTLAGAVLQPAERAAEQAMGIATRHQVVAIDGTTLAVDAQTLCIHSDTPGAAEIARLVRERLLAGGVSIQPLRTIAASKP